MRTHRSLFIGGPFSGVPESVGVKYGKRTLTIRVGHWHGYYALADKCYCWVDVSTGVAKQ